MKAMKSRAASTSPVKDLDSKLKSGLPGTPRSSAGNSALRKSAMPRRFAAWLASTGVRDFQWSITPPWATTCG